MKKGKIIAALNIGSANIICIIANIDHEGNYEILGVGHQLSSGIRAGIITDFDKAEKAVVKAITAAETEAGCNIDKAFVSVSSPKIYSEIVTNTVPVAGQEITERDIERMVYDSLKCASKEDYEVIDYFPLEYFIDGTGGIIDPRSMFGKVLGGRIHVINAQSTMMVNLANCLAKCHLNIEEFLLSSFSSAFAVLEKEEMNLGATVIDIGASSTSFSIFVDNKIIYTSTIPVGGMHITSDLAHAFSINVNAAEKLKILHGKTIFTQNDKNQIIDLESLFEDSEISLVSEEISTSLICGVIRPRVEEILEIVKIRLETIGMPHVCTKRIVLTGGTSQLYGIKELASITFKRNVRIGKVRQIEGLKPEHLAPTFASAVGCLLFATHELNKNQVNFKENYAFFRKIFSFFK